MDVKERKCLESGCRIVLCELSETGEPGTSEKTFEILSNINDNGGASVACYEARPSSGSQGVLKEFYPIESIRFLERDADGILYFKDPEKQEKEYRKFQNERGKYREHCQRIIEAQRIAARKSENSDFEEKWSRKLATFIPPFILYGNCINEKKQEGTVYLWMPNQKFKTFEEICSEIQNAPETRPEYKLYTALYVIKYLTEAVQVLHNKGLVHRDIKPSNFGFEDKGNEDETLAQTLKIFDIDSVCPLNEEAECVGTPGYMEMSADYPARQTDIYSIGATLFHAIIITDETENNGYLYGGTSADYNRLKDMVAESRLIRASEVNSRKELQDILTTILKKCLHRDRRRRYGNCEYLLNDIEKALKYTLSPEMERLRADGKAWTLADVKKNMDGEMLQAMRYHLYEHPLYLCAENGERILKICLLGFGMYGQKILDLCLEMGQNLAMKLCVTVVADRVEEIHKYFAERPAFRNFFDVIELLNENKGDNKKHDYIHGRIPADDGAREGIMSGNRDSYGTVIFRTVYITEKSPKRYETADLDAFKEYIDMWSETGKGETPHYIFAVTDNSRVNISLEEYCVNVLNSENCVISYLYENRVNIHPETSRTEKKKQRMAFPLSINAWSGEDRERRKKDIERMAYNAHLVWNSETVPDYREIKKEFMEGYNYGSSVANALSIKYKLYGVGIELKEDNYSQAAEKFAKEVLGTGQKASRLKEELVCREHKRWVVEKVSDGYTKRSMEEYLVDGKSRDTQKKQHICLVRSNARSGLKNVFWMARNYENWDRPLKDAELREVYQKIKKNEIGDIGKSGKRVCSEPSNEAVNEWIANYADLDDLDRLSVDMHLAVSFKPKDFHVLSESSHNIREIRDLLDDGKPHLQVSAAFEELFDCMKEIAHGFEAEWNQKNGILQKVYLYEGLLNSLKKAADQLPKGKKEKLCNKIDELDRIFWPMKASMEYKDWKELDERLIENIPFILAYREDIAMVVPLVTTKGQLECGEKTSGTESTALRLFDNVGALTVVNPQKIYFLCPVGSEEEMNELPVSAGIIADYIERKKLSAKPCYVILDQNDYLQSSSREEKLAKQLQKAEIWEETDRRQNLSGESHEKRSLEEKGHFHFINGESRDEVMSELKCYLKDSCPPSGIMVLEKNETNVSVELKKYGFENDFASYRFDSSNMKFSSLIGSEWFPYIGRRPYIGLEDLVVFRKKVDTARTRLDSSRDMEKLWGIYCADPGLWKEFCNILRRYEEKTGCIVSFRKENTQTNPSDCKNRVSAAVDDIEESCSYYISTDSGESVRKILKQLVTVGLAGEESRVIDIAAEECRVIFAGSNLIQKEFERLLAKEEMLKSPERLTFRWASNTLYVFYNQRTVSNCLVSVRQAKRMLRLTKFLHKQKYLLGFCVGSCPEKMQADDFETWNFTFDTYSTKQLLTDPNRLMRLYVLKNIRSKNAFDSITGSMEIEYNGREEKSEAFRDEFREEFDFIITSGFQTYFVKCISPEDDALEKDKRLNEFIKQYEGINARPWLVKEEDFYTNIAGQEERKFQDPEEMGTDYEDYIM